MMSRSEKPTNANPSEFNPEVMPGAVPVPFSWEAIFPESKPVVVEIGSGKGTWLIRQAQEHPENNYFGIEYASKFYRMMRDRVRKRKLSNMRVTPNDAIDFLTNLVPSDSIDTLHIYFPDPWPKKRHHKRRLFSDFFCPELVRTLKPNGVFYFATDHAAYFQDVFPIIKSYFAVELLDNPWPDAPQGRTNYEIKYMREGRPIWRCICKHLVK